MALATTLPEVEQRILDLLNANKAALGLNFIERGGDQNTILPDYPAVSVVGRRKRRRYAGTQKYELQLVVSIIVQFNRIGDESTTETSVETVAEAVEKYINDNRQLLDSNQQNQIVIQGMVTGVDYGIVTNREASRRAVSITYEGLSQEYFA